MLKKVVILTAAFLVLGGMSSAFADSWVGTVSDSMCGAKHARAGDEAATCVAKCVAGGSKYVLVSKGKVYQLDPQDKFTDFAGKSVKARIWAFRTRRQAGTAWRPCPGPLRASGACLRVARPRRRAKFP